MRVLDLEIHVPAATVARLQVLAVRAADATGSFGILPGHEPLLTVLEPGLLTFRPAAGGAERYVAVDGGVLHHAGNRVTVLTREAVLAPDTGAIDEVVMAEFDRARAREETARSEFAQLEVLLRRELARHVAHDRRS